MLIPDRGTRSNTRGSGMPQVRDTRSQHLSMMVKTTGRSYRSPKNTQEPSAETIASANALKGSETRKVIRC